MASTGATAAATVLGLAGLASVPRTSRAAEATGPPRPRAFEQAEHAPPAGSTAWARACSVLHPLCVAAEPGTSARTLLAALDAANRAWEALTGALAVPAPDRSDDGFWHVYLVAPATETGTDLSGGGTAMLERHDPSARFERGQSFALVDRTTPQGCRLDLALARAVARGAGLRSAPATDRGSAVAEAETLARLATPCASGADDAATFQGHPERTPVDPWAEGFDRGAALLFDWLDARFGASPGALVAGLWALSPTRATDRGESPSHPTGFDVLRVSLRDRLFPGSTFDDAMVRFAIERAAMLPGARLGWRVGFPPRPRRLLAPEPLAPLGAGYVSIDTGGRPSGATLRLEADWEDYARMRWVVLKLDAVGGSQGELPMGSVYKGTHASLTVENLDGTASLLVVGVDVGDTEAPFDPGAGGWEPHGWTLTLSQP
jgi:hypothetical protein